MHEKNLSPPKKHQKHSNVIQLSIMEAALFASHADGVSYLNSCFFSCDFQKVKVKLSCKFAKLSLILCIFCMVMTMLHTQEMKTYLHFRLFYLMTYVANKLHLFRINQHLDKNISLYARLMKHVVAIKYLFHIL